MQPSDALSLAKPGQPRMVSSQSLLSCSCCVLPALVVKSTHHALSSARSQHRAVNRDTLGAQLAQPRERKGGEVRIGQAGRGRAIGGEMVDGHCYLRRERIQGKCKGKW